MTPAHLSTKFYQLIMETSSEDLREFLLHAAKLLSNQPEEVRIELVPGGGKTACFLLTCHAQDMKYIIGKEGSNINALRKLLLSMAAKQKMIVNVIVQD